MTRDKNNVSNITAINKSDQYNDYDRVLITVSWRLGDINWKELSSLFVREDDKILILQLQVSPSLTQWISLFQRGSSLINRCPHYLRINDVPKIVHIQFDEFFYRFILTNSLVIIAVTVISLPVQASARTTNLTRLVTISLSILIWVFSTLSLLLAPKVRDVRSAFIYAVQGYYMLSRTF